METIYAVLMGVTQGITELLPISSSGHLILLEELFGREPEVVILTTLHLGSAVALLFVYWRDLWEILFSDGNIKFLRNIVIAAIPVILVGVFAGDWIDNIFYNPGFIAFNLAFWGVVMIITEKFEVKLHESGANRSSLARAVVVGLFQTLSLLPGTSRSGITTMAGMWVGEEKSKALDFSFLLGIPLLFGAFLFSFTSEIDQIGTILTPATVIAFFVSLIVSFIAAKLLRHFSKRRFLTFFGVYRIILAIVVGVYFFTLA